MKQCYICEKESDVLYPYEEHKLLKKEPNCKTYESKKMLICKDCRENKMNDSGPAWFLPYGC